jgi:hypothetical protein
MNLASMSCLKALHKLFVLVSATAAIFLLFAGAGQARDFETPGQLVCQLTDSQKAAEDTSDHNWEGRIEFDFSSQEGADFVSGTEPVDKLSLFRKDRNFFYFSPQERGRKAGNIMFNLHRDGTALLISRARVQEGKKKLAIDSFASYSCKSKD